MHNNTNVPHTQSISEERRGQEGAGDSSAQWALGADTEKSFESMQAAESMQRGLKV